MKKIGLFGCTADPFTLAHREIVKQALEQGFVDTVYICPTIVTWHRSNYIPWLNDEDKNKVIYKLTDGMQAYVYNDDLRRRSICNGNKILEERFVNNHRFIDTLMNFRSSYPSDDDQFYVIVGSDEYDNFEKWYAYDSILKLCKGLIVVTDQDGNGRDGKSVAVKNDPLFKNVKFLKIDKKFNNVSATRMRNKYTSCQSYIEDMVNIINGNTKDEIICRTPIFDVVEGYKHANGLKPIKIDAPDWVSIMVEKDGKLLVEKQFRYGADDFVEEFPCGIVEEGEDPFDAAVRELREETGIDVLDRNKIIKLGQTNPNPAFMTNMMHYYYVNLDNAEYRYVERELDEHEEIEIQWKDKNKFMFDLADDAHACGKIQVPAIALAMVKLYENASNYPSCGG